MIIPSERWQSPFYKLKVDKVKNGKIYAGESNFLFTLIVLVLVRVFLSNIYSLTLTNTFPQRHGPVKFLCNYLPTFKKFSAIFLFKTDRMMHIRFHNPDKRKFT